MAVSVPLLFIDPQGNFAGAGLGTERYQGGHRVAYLNDRCLTGTVKICRLQIQFSGFVGAGATGAVLISVDRKKYSSNKSLYPLTQNTDYFQQMQIGQMSVYQTPDNRLWLGDIVVRPPIEYVPGEDCIVICVDCGGTSTATQLLCWLPSLVMDTTPTWPTDDAPNDMPDWDCAAEIAASRQGGNDWYTRLLLRGDECVNGSPSFQDRSWRNYTVRWWGDVRLKDGWYDFAGKTGGAGIMAPEVYGPGFAADEDATHIDWNLRGDFTWDMVVKPATISNAWAPIMSFTKWYGPFLIAQRNGKLHFYATTANGGWNVVENVEVGTVAANAETHIAVEREGNALRFYQDGVMTWSTTVSGPLFYPLLPTGLPRGRPIFGMQADVSPEIAADGQSGFYVGKMKEIRFSKIARYGGTTFTPPASPYSP